MEIKIRPITATLCKNKQSGEFYTRLDYLNLGKSNQSEKVKGKIVQHTFLGVEMFGKIPESIMFEDVTATFDYEENARNPMKPRVVLIGLKSKNDSVDLL